MKFVLSHTLCREGMERIKTRAEVFVANDSDPINFIDELRDADAVILRIGRFDKSVIKASPKLKVIGRTGVGYDNIDVKAATEAGIPVVITPGANTRSVAEHAVAMMLAISKNPVNGQHRDIKSKSHGGSRIIQGFELLDKFE